MTATTNILDQPLNDLDVSEEFRRTSHQMGFQTLNDIVKAKEAVIRENQFFTYHWFVELIRFMRSRELLHLLEDKSRF